MTETKELREVKKDIFEIKKTGRMKVPLRIFSDARMMDKLKEDKTVEQGMNMATIPGIQKQAIIMPDAHQGYGFPVGGVAAFDMEEGAISPGGIGYDINCGVRLLTSNLKKDEVEKKIKELLDVLFSNIHCGVGSESGINLSKQELDEVMNQGMDWALKKGFATADDIDHCEENGRMKTADAKFVSEKAKARGKNQLGTLGAGNHFVEIQYVDEIYDEKVAKAFGITGKGQIVVMIHSGSRGLGHQVCTDYLRKIEKELPELVSALPDKELAYAPTGSRIAEEYLKAMSAAANFGWCNRQLMVYNARKSFKQVFPESELKTLYDVAHNMAKIEEHEIDGKIKKVYVHRKGATRAFGPGHKEIPQAYRKVGQPILIPGSMGTASYVLVGTDVAMKETFGSTPHGAGRVMSRHKANQLFSGEKIKNELEKQKIYVKAKSWKGISEEAPQAYKDIDEVIEVTDAVGIGKKVARLRPLGVLKG